MDEQLHDARPMRIKFLAYIEQFFAPADLANIHETTYPNESKGYVCDVTVLLQTGVGNSTREKAMIHFGDGVIRRTFEETQQHIFDETGIVVEKIPESELPEIPKTGAVFVRVGRLVRGFVEDDRPVEAILADQRFEPSSSGLRGAGGSIFGGSRQKKDSKLKLVRAK